MTNINISQKQSKTTASHTKKEPKNQNKQPFPCLNFQLPVYLLTILLLYSEGDGIHANI
jgi:hypothetical protein